MQIPENLLLCIALNGLSLFPRQIADAEELQFDDDSFDLVPPHLSPWWVKDFRPFIQCFLRPPTELLFLCELQHPPPCLSIPRNDPSAWRE
jgi:hypothetical protein